METEIDKIENIQKPVMPLWASIPLYIIATFFLMGIGAAIIPLGYIESDSVIFSVFKQIIEYGMSAIAITIATLLFILHVDRTSVKELGLSIRGRGKDCLMGFLVAAIIYAIGFSVSLALGVIFIEDVRFDITILILNFVLFFCVSWGEELMMRGYIQGRLMTGMNKFLALILASFLFSAMHLANPNLAVLPIINLFLAGLLLGASFLYTRNLWFPIVLHLFWNWIQGPMLGYEVSGNKLSPSLLKLSLPDNNILNGGDFGFEGSIICTILTIIGTAIIIWWGETNQKKKQSVVK